MRLIDVATNELHEVVGSKIPPYAILSHTWGDEEVSFQDFSSPNPTSKKGYQKIKKASDLAQNDGLRFLWVDTCCIDKSSSSELSESINSMFQWYSDAVVCYAFIEDLSPVTPTKSGLTECRWFTRGWTLQELLAPRVVKFYDADWKYRGTKDDFASTISGYTGIPVDTLKGKTAISESSIAARMSWAACRQTTRAEDKAYCLLGIFNLNMPLLYGEGDKSFRRLQGEILRQSNDLTIFAWDSPESVKAPYITLLAPSPICFSTNRHIVADHRDTASFTLTNKGLFLSGDVPLRTALVDTGSSSLERLYILQVGAHQDSVSRQPSPRGIYLRKISPGIFYRVGHLGLSRVGGPWPNRFKGTERYDASDKCIIVDPNSSDLESLITYRKHSLHVPIHPILKLKRPIPGFLWDHTDRVFLQPSPNISTRYSMVIALLFEGILESVSIELVVLCDYRKVAPVFKVFHRAQFPLEVAFIFQERHRGHALSWEDLAIYAPKLATLKHYVDAGTGSGLSQISASSIVRLNESIDGSFKATSLLLDING